MVHIDASVPAAPAPHKSAVRRWLGFVVALVVSAALMAWMARSLDFAALWQAMGRFSWTAVAAAIVLQWLHWYASTLRYQWVLEDVGGAKTGIGRLFRLNMLTQFVANVAPVSAAGDAVRAAHAWHRLGLSPAIAAECVLFDRILGVLGLVVLAAVSLPVQARVLDNPSLLWGQVLVCVAAGGGIVAAILLARWSWLRRFAALAWVSVMADHFLRPLWPARRLTRQTLVTVLRVFTHSLTQVILGWNLGHGEAWPLLLALGPLVLFVQNLPFFYAGWGAREAVVIAALTAGGIFTPEEALALSVMLGAGRLAASLPGGLMPLLRHHGRETPIHHRYRHAAHGHAHLAASHHVPAVEHPAHRERVVHETVGNDA